MTFLRTKTERNVDKTSSRYARLSRDTLVQITYLLCIVVHTKSWNNFVCYLFDRAFQALQNPWVFRVWKSGPQYHIIRTMCSECHFSGFLANIEWFFTQKSGIRPQTNIIFGTSTKNCLYLYVFQTVSTTFVFRSIFTPTPPPPQGYIKKWI
jgi:hypothetical protein